MNDTLTFIAFSCFLLTGIVLFAYTKYGKLSVLIDNGAAWGLVYALLAMSTIGVVLFFLAGNPANASTWFKYSQVYLGIETNAAGKQSPQCFNREDSLTSNLGVTQHVFEMNNVAVVANYQHHSCVVGKDQNTYDMFGTKIIWTIPR